MNSPASRISPFRSFEEAARAVLELLHDRLGLSLWMVTRTAGEEWIVLDCVDGGYGVEPGTVFRWSDSFCSRMVEGLGPRMAPDSAQFPAYVEAPIGRQVSIGAYIGIPIEHPDGSLFGTLCAIDPAAQPQLLQADLALVELLGRLLGTAAATQAMVDDVERRAERAEAAAQTDALTGLPNRRAWDELLEFEEARCRRLGSCASVLVIDLDGLKCANDTLGHVAGDALLTSAATTLRETFRDDDLVARVGGDEFFVLAPGADEATALGLRDRAREALAEAGIEASLGVATRLAGGDLDEACCRADTQMYNEKRGRRALV